MLTSAVLRMVGFCTRHPWPVIIFAAMLAIGSALYTVAHFAITTDTDQLLPKDLPWRQDERAYRAAFPQDQILAVVEGPTPELVEMAADRLAAELRARDGRFSSVRRPQGSEFVQRSAWLLLPVDQVSDATGRLVASKPLIEVLATDPSLRGVMHALTIGIGAGQARRMPPDELARPMNILSDTLDDLFAGRFPSFSWRTLMSGHPAAPDELRGLIQIQPKLDFGALEPGRAAIDAIRQAADELKLGPRFGTRLRLTGQVAINDEQFVLLGKGMLPNLAGTVLAVLFILWLALLTVFGPPSEQERMGFVALAPADRFLARHRVAVIAGTIIVVLAGIPLLSQMRFDFDPIHLQDPDAEAVSTYRELITVPEIGISSANIVAPSVAEVDEIIRRAAGRPEVSGTRSIQNLVPSDQDAKLPAIQRAAAALGPAIKPSATRPAPSDEETIGAIRAALTDLRRLASAGADDAAAAASRLAGLLDRLANGDAAMRDKARDALVAPLMLDLNRLRNMLRPERVTVQSVPSELARDWVSPDGRARIEVMPQGDPNDTATLRQFAAAALAVAPDVTGTPVWLIEAEHTIVRAFIEAGALAVLSIAVMLWIALRRFRDVVLTLLPLIVAGAVTLELMVLIGESLNFANVIALPLLLGVGVAFKIYYITAWRAGRTNLLQSTLTRAVFYSALTTVTAFGSLWLSKQPGLSSMGKLMALALACTLAAAVLFQPALMGPPRGDNARKAA